LAGALPVVAAALVAALAVTPRAAADEPPRLWEPGQAVTFLLDDAPPARPPSPAPDAAGAAAPAWQGSLGQGVTLALFGTYRTLLSSQDLPVCAFSPSCSRFSQQAIDRCGFFQGALLSLDRLLRDHPGAVGFYPPDEGGKLLIDLPERYCLTAPR
jgi:putative component of membrane protein insertase Oxa1/YidC/SpoIIIJ protein YidD